MVVCDRCGELVPSRPGRGGIIVLCPRDGNRLQPAPGGTPLRPVPPPRPTEVIAPEPMELPSDRLKRLPPLGEGQCRAHEAVGRCIQHPGYPDRVARVFPSGRPEFVEIQAGPGLVQLIAANLPVTPVPDVPLDETDPEPLINRQLHERMVRERHGL
jgi:hypothetical protein